MTVGEFAQAIRSGEVTDGSFYPWHRPRGYRAAVRVGNLWYWYSVSNTDRKITPAEVADAITDCRLRRIQRSNPYKNGRGFEATVWSGDHCYMLGHGDNKD